MTSHQFQNPRSNGRLFTWLLSVFASIVVLGGGGMLSLALTTEGRVSANETHIELFGSKLERIEAKLDRLLERR